MRKRNIMAGLQAVNEFIGGIRPKMPISKVNNRHFMILRIS